MKLDIFQIDAFADTLFQGNPAAVCVLDNWLPDLVMQAIAGEMNLSETAFVVKLENDYRIRWFTPTTEVKLCGHATLAAAHVLFEHLAVDKQPLRFRSLSGMLIVSPKGDGIISMDFPASPPSPVALTAEMVAAVGGAPQAALAADDLILVYGDASEIRVLQPDFARVKQLPFRGVAVTAPGSDGYDFVSRFFAPRVGIDEDPVTGSSFTKLAPYYQERLGKTEFLCRQLSRRGGEALLNTAGDRVHITGRAYTALRGELYLP